MSWEYVSRSCRGYIYLSTYSKSRGLQDTQLRGQPAIRGHSAERTIHWKDNLRSGDTLPRGQSAERTTCDQGTLCREDNLLRGHSAERTIRREDNLRSEWCTICHVWIFPLRYRGVTLKTGYTAYIYRHVTSVPTAYIYRHVTSVPTAYIYRHVTSFPTAYIYRHITSVPTAYIYRHVTSFPTIHAKLEE